MKLTKKTLNNIILSSALALGPIAASAHEPPDICPNAGTRDNIYNVLKAALIDAQSQENGGFGFEMWGAVVNRDGVVCAIAFTGHNRGSQWPGSRAIAAQKANTANAFTLPEKRRRQGAACDGNSRAGKGGNEIVQ